MPPRPAARTSAGTGWRARHCFDPRRAAIGPGLTLPVSDYGHDLGCTVIGGDVYRGAAQVPALRGGYVFGDYCSGTLWAIDAGLDASERVPITLLETHRAISAIGVDDEGEVVMTDLSGGELLRLVAAP